MNEIRGELRLQNVPSSPPPNHPNICKLISPTDHQLDVEEKGIWKTGWKQGEFEFQAG